MKGRSKWVMIATASAIAGWLAFDSMPAWYLYYSPSGPEKVPVFSSLTRVGFGCGVAAATLALLCGVAFLVSSMRRDERALALVALAGWWLFGLLAALVWSFVDGIHTFLARANLAGLYWAFDRGAMLGLIWMCAVIAIALALQRWWPTTRPNDSLGQPN